MPGLRPDRLATLYFFHPIQRLLGRTEAGIPILMYHRISAGDEGEKNPYFLTSTHPDVFRAHVECLAARGYRTIGLREAVQRLRDGSGSSGKYVVLTFDDGLKSFYTDAFPILCEHSFSATVFLATAYVGGEFKGMACLTWGQVRELHRAGTEFGSHTLSHPQLHDLPLAEVEREVRCSKEQIEDSLGASVPLFSYPYAFPETDRWFRGALRSMLVSAGYEAGVSTTVGKATASSDPLFLERLPVNTRDDLPFLNAKLQAGYDWLHAVQYAWKVLKLLKGPRPSRATTSSS